VPAVFIILALLTVLSGVAAVSLRNLVHCALALAVAFGGLAALYLQLDAQFVGFAQILVYIGAVAILIVFAILLTRGSEPAGTAVVSGSWCVSGAVALCVFGVLATVIRSSKALVQDLPPAPQTTVRQIGDQLMTRYVLPLEVLGLLLTAAMIGAVIIAMRDGPKPAKETPPLETAAAGSANGAEQSESDSSSRGAMREMVTLQFRAASSTVGSPSEEGKA